MVYLGSGEGKFMNDIYLHLLELFEEKEYGKLLLVVLLIVLMVLPGFTYFYIFDQRTFIELEFMKFLILIVLSSVVFILINSVIVFAILAPRYLKMFKKSRIKIWCVSKLHHFYCRLKSEWEESVDLVVFDKSRISKTMLLISNIDSQPVKDIYSATIDIVTIEDDIKNAKDFPKVPLLSEAENMIYLLDDIMESAYLDQSDTIDNLYIEIVSSLCSIVYVIIAICWITFFIFDFKVPSVIVFKIEYLLILLYFNHENKKKLSQTESEREMNFEKKMLNEDSEGLKQHKLLFFLILGFIIMIGIIYFENLNFSF